MNKTLRAGLILAVMFSVITLTVYAAVVFPAGTAFLSEAGGGEIVFAEDITVDNVTWVGDQVRFGNLWFDTYNWGNIGFSAPPTSIELNTTIINSTHILIDNIQSADTIYEVYLPFTPNPSVAGADAFNYVFPTLSFTMTANSSVVISWAAPPVPALVQTQMLAESYTEGNYSNSVQMVSKHPSLNASVSSIGQSFNSSGDHRITSAQFYVRKVGAPSGNATAVLYAHSGVFGTSSVPTGAALATSDPVDVSTFGAALGLITFNFTGVNQYLMDSEVLYCIAFINPGTGVMNATNRVEFGRNNTAGGHPGNEFIYQNNAWVAIAGSDAIFYVYAEALPPVNVALNDDTPYIRNVWQWMNFTIYDPNGWRNLATVTVQVNTTTDANNYTMRWTQSGNTFTEVSDPDSIITLNTTTSLRTLINATKIELSFNVTFTAGQSGLCDALVTTIDDEGKRDTDLYSNGFQFTFFNWDTAVYDLINSLFENFGIIGYVQQAIAAVTAVATHFTDSLSGLILLINLQFQIVWATVG